MTRPERQPLTADQQAMALKYIPLARSIARPFKMSWPAHSDDFESAAMTAICEAAQSYDPGRGVKFSTFARHRIWGSLRDVQRSVLALGWRCDPKHAPKLTSLPRRPEGKGRVLGAEDDLPVGHELDDLDEIEAWLRKLPAKHARICRRVYVHGETQHEAAAALGMSQSRLSYLHRKAMEILDGSWAEKVKDSA